MKAEVDADELTHLLAENKRLSARVDELLADNTRVVMQAREVNIRNQVSAFHRVFNQPILEEPTVPPNDRVRHRLRLIAEEFFELLDACTSGWSAEPWMRDDIEARVDKYLWTTTIKVDIVEVVDALADLDYVVEGTRLEFGIRGMPVALEVHRSNMTKVGGSVSPTGKIQKPEGWKPPDIAGVLRAQGWRSTSNE